MIARCIALGLPIAWVPIRTIYAGEPSHIRPWRHFTRVPPGQPRRAPDRPRAAADDRRWRRSATRSRRRRAGAVGPARRSAALDPDRGCSIVAALVARRASSIGLLERPSGSTTPRRPTCSRSSRSPSLRGTGPAIATAIGAFLTYDFLFIEPYYTFTVRDPAEWLNLLLLLVVGVVVGRLAGRERDRAIAAIEGEREASAMFNVSFTLATERDTSAALGPDRRDGPRSRRRRAGSGSRSATRLVADTAASGVGPPVAPAVHVVLRRRPGDEPAEWVRVHAPGRAARSPASAPDARRRTASRSPPATRSFGSIWVIRPRELGDPDPGRDPGPRRRRRPDRRCAPA